jgi:GxxExxY protein
MTEDEVMSLCDLIRETGYAAHAYLGPGQAEKIYENALANRLTKKGLKVEQQKPIQVLDEDGTLLGDFYADLFVNDWLVIELKAAKALIDEHVAQLFGYLRSSRREHGLLINFGARKYQIRKFVCDIHQPNGFKPTFDATL